MNLKVPFENDPFAMVALAFERLYPGIDYEAHWEPEIRPAEDGGEVYGLTDFGADGVNRIFITPHISVSDAVEIFAHELAHVAVGIEHEHDEVWETVFDEIFDAYNQIGEEMFGEQE